jgi:Spy/CpxP family protein refolding chaperone
MKAKFSMSMMMAALALLAFSAPVPAFSQMKDTSMKGHGEGHGQMMGTGNHGPMMGMGDMDMMGMGNMGMMGMCAGQADPLGLTDDQVMKMKPVTIDMQKKQARFMADLKIAQIELGEIMDVKDFDLEKANAAVKKIEDTRTSHQLEMVKNMKEIRTILTEEQFNKSRKMRPMHRDEKKPAKKTMKK